VKEMEYDTDGMLMQEMTTNLGSFKLLFQRTRSFHHRRSVSSKVQSDLKK